MNIKEILKNEIYHNFIYDNSKEKILIGGRRVGKTSTLLLKLINESVSWRDKSFLYIVPQAGMVKIISSYMKDICKEMNIKYETISNSFSNVKISINDNNINILSASDIKDGIYIPNLKEIYIDEPGLFTDFDYKYSIIRHMMLKDDSSISIAGSLINSNTNFKNIINDDKYRRHIITCQDAMSTNDFDQLIRSCSDSMPTEQLNESLLCITKI